MVIKIIGCGGIGGIVTRGVHKLANASKNKIILIDNDTFEFGNISRQTFSTFGNKAEVLAEELSSLPHNVASIVANSDRYTFGCSSPTRIGDKQIIFCCVDNHFTRAIVNAHCKELANVTLISGGNEIQDGNVQFVVKKRGKIVAGDYLDSYHPELSLTAHRFGTLSELLDSPYCKKGVYITTNADYSRLIGGGQTISGTLVEYDCGLNADSSDDEESGDDLSEVGLRIETEHKGTWHTSYGIDSEKDKGLFFEILNSPALATESAPDEGGCMGNEQLFVANNMAASIMLNIFQRLLFKDFPEFTEVVFDTFENKVMPIARKRVGQ